MNRKRIKRKLHKDNRGSGLIMVLIMIAFLGILSGILLFAAYGGYQMRLIDKQGKANFYTAESVLDEINVGLQVQVSNALSDAYSDVMVNYSLYGTAEVRTQKLHKKYYGTLQSLVQGGTGATYNIHLLRGFVSPELLGDGASADGSRDHFGTYGAIVESNIKNSAGNDVYTLALNENGIVLKDLRVTYVDEKGNVSIISTDIRLALPDVSFSESSTFPDLSGFCFIADETAKVGNSVVGGSVTINGSAYAKDVQLGKQIGYDHTGNPYNFQGTPVRFIGSSTPGSENLCLVAKNHIIIENAVLETTSTDLWCKDIDVNSSDVMLEGNTYVRNDVNINGIGSQLKLSGMFEGYGTNLNNADASSAIVVNGRESVLDFSALKLMYISGHTFVSTSTSGLKTDVDLATDVNKDFLMGESVAVKSNQLIYLVPPEALGCDKTTGESLFSSNPMTMTQYQTLVDNPDKYEILKADEPIAALDNNTLGSYMALRTMPDGSTGYAPVKMVRQTGTGVNLVYFYMDFKNASAANDFFVDYYRINASEVDKYTRLYAEAIKMPTGLDTRFYLAGNVLTYENEASAGVILSATDDDLSVQNAEERMIQRSDTFAALIAKMVKNLVLLTPEEQTRDVFANVIDETALIEMVDALDPVHNTYTLVSADGSKKVVLSKGDYLVTPADDDVRMIICCGDVRLKEDFKGLIIAGGNVIIGDETDNDTNVELEPLTNAEFSELLLIHENDAGGMARYVLDVFRDGVNQAHGGTVLGDTGTKEVVLADLIIYERWSKQ